MRDEEHVGKGEMSEKPKNVLEVARPIKSLAGKLKKIGSTYNLFLIFIKFSSTERLTYVVNTGRL